MDRILEPNKLLQAQQTHEPDSKKLALFRPGYGLYIKRKSGMSGDSKSLAERIKEGSNSGSYEHIVNILKGGLAIAPEFNQ